ncbi:MAG: hypothetical protein ABH824_06045 [Nanoarchaeota archaeon]|nr:hypothetical protein [Nanoarchaeota archaeon]MBU1632577.1 hypothetical protein [Nanoarchaeota archaeon]MBU1875787.1 hypothetical protein [Nanoarchaeota archaeon]
MKKKHEKKAAIDLSINTIVIIIISLVILAGGVSLLYKFIGGAEEIKADLDLRTQDELERLLVDQGKRVALPLHVADIERGKSHVFGIGMLNTLDNKEDFYIEIISNKVIDTSEQDVTGQQKVMSWLSYRTDGISIASGNNQKESILVSIPDDAIKGQYIFTATVKTTDMNSYGNPQKFIVNVK